jgi:hypothetical protein
MCIFSGERKMHGANRIDTLMLALFCCLLTGSNSAPVKGTPMQAAGLDQPMVLVSDAPHRGGHGVARRYD